MKAAVMYERHKPLVLDDVDPAANELEVELVASGVCYSDQHHLERETWIKPPVVLGHEGAGVVKTVGAAERTVVNQNNIVKIREDAPLDVVCIVGDAVATGVGAVIHTAEVEPGSNVVVVGTGGVGLNVIQGARLAGAERIIAVDLLDNKLEFAHEMGAGEVARAVVEIQ